MKNFIVKAALALSLVTSFAFAGQPPAQVIAKNNISAQEFWVTKDVGNDANDCSALRPCKTIQAGINAANALAAYYKQAIVHVAPSTSSANYAENLTLSQQGVAVMCDSPVANTRACNVSGSLTVNLTGTAGGGNFIAASNEVYVNGFVFTNGASTALLFSGTTFQRLVLVNCYFQTSSAITANFSNTGVNGVNSTAVAFDTFFENNSASNAVVTISAGRFWTYGSTSTLQNDTAASAGTSLTVTGPASVILNVTQLIGQVSITDNTATVTFNLSTIASGVNPCIVTPSSPSTGYSLLAYFGCNSSNTNSITGTGVVANAPGNVRFGTSGDIASTVTQLSIGPGLPQGEILVGPGATTGTNVLLSIFGGHIKVSQTTAPTAVVNANAGTSATCTLTNGRDSSGIINLTEGSASWASGTQCTITFNKAYGVAPNCVMWPHNAAAASHFVTQQFFSTTTTTTLLLATGAADSAATASQWSYKCEEP